MDGGTGRGSGLKIMGGYLSGITDPVGASDRRGGALVWVERGFEC
jgi:hypothetical protein